MHTTPTVDTDSLLTSDDCQVMGILNLTDDSFSDGGRYLDPATARQHAATMAAAGADIIDIGGESTRPGAHRVTAEEEYDRVVPMVRALSEPTDGEDGHQPPPISVDTMRASVAEGALAAGAWMLNDVSGGLADPDLLRVAANAQCPICLMHWNTDVFGNAAGCAPGPQSGPEFVRTVIRELSERVDNALAAGVRSDRIVLDPGLGFAKSPAGNWTLLQHLDELQELGFPLLIGASRKRFVQALHPAADLKQQPLTNPSDTHGADGAHGADQATAAISALAAAGGAWAVRVHAVQPSAVAVRVARAWNHPQETNHE